MNNIIFIVMDSCRYDAYMAANTPNFDRLGTAQRRFSYASWTAPSHYTFLMGMLPHQSPTNVFASEVYKDEFAQWSDRLGEKSMEFKDFLPQLSLPKVLSGLGYYTIGRVSMPVLNQHTLISKYFDDYKLMDNHNDFATMVDEINLSATDPEYHFLNLGETHYPYMLDGDNLPRVSGVHGVFKSMGASGSPIASSDTEFFDQKMMQRLQQQQIACVEYLDGQFGRLLDKCPENTHFIITADHGELFGEDGFFGHGPIMHEKVFEVPFIEGRL
jgi:hypothetical protein